MADNSKVVDKLYNYFGGVYTRNEIKSMFDKMVVAMKEVLIENDELDVYQFGRIYINYEGEKKLKDFVNNKDIVRKVYTPRFKPSKALKREIKKKYNNGGD